MKKLKLLINSKTSGKYHREIIDGRSHIVTTMMAIRGDTAMNGINYPDDQIQNSFMQLNNLPAPSDHPRVNGVHVLAAHPVANNKQNIGGWLRNPRKKGPRVFVDFMLDEEIANNSADGKETIRRIEAGEKIGVSTGLGIGKVVNKSGVDQFGEKYTREGSDFKFDHVAILLSEAAAGAHAGTELITNSEECEITTYNGVLNEKFDDITEVFEGDDSYTVSLDDGVIVVNHKSQTTEKVDIMEKKDVVLAIVQNTANSYTVADIATLAAKSDAELNGIIATNSIDEKQSKDFLTVNSSFDFAGYESFKASKAEFDLFVANQAEQKKTVIDNIVTNSEYTADMLTGKDTAELTLITNMLTPKKTAVHTETLAVNSTNKTAGDKTAGFDFT